MHRFAHSIAATFAAAAILSSSAAAQPSPDIVRAMRLLKKFYDAGLLVIRGLKAGSGGPMVIDDDVVVALEEELRRIEQHRLDERVPELKIAADRALSEDSHVRAEVRREIASHLAADKREIERLEKERASLEADHRKWAGKRDEAEALRRGVEEVLDDYVMNLFDMKLAEVWFDLYEHVEKPLNGVVSEYERHLKTHDRVLERRRARHAEFEIMKETLETIHGVRALQALPADGVEGRPRQRSARPDLPDGSGPQPDKRNGASIEPIDAEGNIEAAVARGARDALGSLSTASRTVHRMKAEASRTIEMYRQTMPPPYVGGPAGGPNPGGGAFGPELDGQAGPGVGGSGADPVDGRLHLEFPHDQDGAQR